MKKVLIVVGSVALGVIVLLGIGIGSMMYFGRDLDSSSKEFVDQAIPAVCTGWDASALTSRSSQQLLDATPEAKIAELMAAFSGMFGPMTKYGGSKGDSNMMLNIPHGLLVTARYQAEVTFEKGRGTILIRLNREDGKWKLLQFNVSPTK